MFKTHGEIKTKLNSINLDGKSQRQKDNHEILSNWTKPFDKDAAISPRNAETFAKRIKNIETNIIQMSEITKSKIESLNDSMSDTLYLLYWRWQDEKEYEDWNDYISVMKKKFETLIVSNNMQNAVYFSCGKRPFGIRFDFEGFRVTLFVNSTHFGWKSKQL